LSGQVIGPDGAPISGASVALASSASATGPDGRFLLPRSSGLLKVSHPDFFPREIDADRLSGASLVLRPGGRISGTVTDRSGRPVAGARAAFGRAESPPEVLTDKDGRYESPLLSRGPVYVFIAHGEFQPVEGTVELDSARVRAAWHVKVLPGRRLGVHVASLDGVPLPDAEVWVQAEGSPAAGGDSTAWRFHGRTGDVGTLETRIEPGRSARVRARLPGFREKTEEAAGESVRLALAPAPSIQGYGVDAQSGLPLKLTGVKLEVLGGAEDSAEHGSLFRSLAQGKFVVGLPPRPGKYRLAVEAEGGLSGKSEPLEVDGTSSPPPLIVRLAPKLELKGLVLGPEGPLAGVTVQLLSLERGERSLKRVFGALVLSPYPTALETRSGEDGRLSFENARLGPFRLHVEREGLAEYLSPPITLPWEGEYPVLLRRGQELSGLLIDSEGLPEPDIPVLLTSEDGISRVSWTDHQGRFVFPSLPPGRDYQLLVGDPTRPASEPLEEGAPVAPEMRPLDSRRVAIEEGKDLVYDVRRPSSPWGSLEGEVEVDGKPAPGVVLFLDRKDAGDLEKGAAKQILTGSKGEFLVRGLLPGSYRLRGADVPAAREVLVEGGRRARVELSLETARLKLKLVAREDGQPFSPEALAELVEGSPSRDERVRRKAALEGQLEWQGLFPGSYLLRIKVKGILVHEERLDLLQDREEVIAIDACSDLLVRLVTPEEKPFQGQAEVVLSRGGKEIYRGLEEIKEAVSVCLPGPGEYELVVRSGDQVARKRFQLGPEGPAGQPGPAGEVGLENSPLPEDNKESGNREEN
jgi:hypothetical protein